MINWNIETRNITELQFNPRNPRTFTKKGLEDLKKSIKKCGDANIITINKNNMVLGGHARLTVMKELGITEVTVKVPDRLLTPQECDEITIRLNANQAGEWDYEILQAEYETDDLTDWGLEVDILDEVTDELLEDEKEEHDEKEIENYQVVCECQTEKEQEALFLKLTNEGINCKLVTI